MRAKPVFGHGPVNQARRRLLSQVRLDGLYAAAAGAFADGVHGSGEAAAHELRLKVHTLPSYISGAVTVIPLRWSTGLAFDGHFPAMDANLELQQTEPGISRLGLTGSYRQASGQPMTSKQQNDVLGTVRQFLGRVATILSNI